MIHELTARNGQANVLGIGYETADSPPKGLISYNGFLVDAGPGYRAHLLTDESSGRMYFF